jgi:hypothetical protein
MHTKSKREILRLNFINRLSGSYMEMSDRMTHNVLQL